MHSFSECRLYTRHLPCDRHQFRFEFESMFWWHKWLITIYHYVIDQNKKKKHSTFTIHLKFQPNFFLFSGFKLLILFNMWHIWIVNNRPLFLSVLTWYIARLVRSHVKSILKWHGHWCPTSIPTTLDIFKNWNHTNNNAKYVVPQSPLNVRCTEYGVHEVI